MSILSRSLLVIGAGTLLVMISSSAFHQEYGHSFLSTRPAFDFNFPELITLFRERAGARKDGHGGAFELSFFGGGTLQTDTIANYFLPNGKDYIIVGEDSSNSAVNRTRDVNAAHFKIITADVNSVAEQGTYGADFHDLTFESRVKFCPKQTFFGLGLAYKHRLPRNFWVCAYAPVIQVRNKLCMNEDVINAGGGHPMTGTYTNFIDAVSQNTDRLYGNMTNRVMKKTRISHLDIQGGYDIVKGEQFLMGGFAGLYIPCGNKPTARCLFEPIVGNNGHVGIEFGNYADIQLLSDKDGRTLTAHLAGTTRYLIPNVQRRSFDLRDKTWSRHMIVWENYNAGLAYASPAAADANADFLINYSTLCVNVHPHFNYDHNMALEYKHNQFRGELGYNLFARKEEELCFCQAMANGIGIAAIHEYVVNQNTTPIAPATNSLATINSPVCKIDGYSAKADEIVYPAGDNTARAYIPITQNDLDLRSGAQPAAISQTFYIGFGYTWDTWKFPFMIDGGASYELSQDNAAVTRWLAWLKVGISI